jgi:hypothetical protein
VVFNHGCAAGQCADHSRAPQVGRLGELVSGRLRWDRKVRTVQIEDLATNEGENQQKTHVIGGPSRPSP